MRSADGTVLLWANRDPPMGLCCCGPITWDCHQSSDRHHKMHATVWALFCPVSVGLYASATRNSMEAGGRFFNCRWGDDVHVGREPPAGGIFRDSVYPYVRLRKVPRARGFGQAFTHNTEWACAGATIFQENQTAQTGGVDMSEFSPPAPLPGAPAGEASAQTACGGR